MKRSPKVLVKIWRTSCDLAEEGRCIIIVGSFLLFVDAERARMGEVDAAPLIAVTIRFTARTLQNNV